MRPKLDPFIAIIDQILEEDKGRLKKQRHTAKRIFERLSDEHGFTGGITIVTDYVRVKKRQIGRSSCHRRTRQAVPRWTSARRLV